MHYIAEIVLSHQHTPSPENSHYAHEQIEKHPTIKCKGREVGERLIGIKKTVVRNTVRNESKVLRS